MFFHQGIWGLVESVRRSASTTAPCEDTKRVYDVEALLIRTAPRRSRPGGHGWGPIRGCACKVQKVCREHHREDGDDALRQQLDSTLLPHMNRWLRSLGRDRIGRVYDLVRFQTPKRDANGRVSLLTERCANQYRSPLPGATDQIPIRCVLILLQSCLSACASATRKEMSECQVEEQASAHAPARRWRWTCSALLAVIGNYFLFGESPIVSQRHCWIASSKKCWLQFQFQLPAKDGCGSKHALWRNRCFNCCILCRLVQPAAGQAKRTSWCKILSLPRIQKDRVGRNSKAMLDPSNVLLAEQLRGRRQAGVQAAAVADGA